MWYVQVYLGKGYLTIAHALFQKQSRFRANADITHVHLLSKRNSPLSCVVLLGFIYFHLSICLLISIPSFKLLVYEYADCIRPTGKKKDLERTIGKRGRGRKKVRTP